MHKRFSLGYIGLVLEASASQQHQEVDRLVNLAFGDRSPDELSDEELAIPVYSEGLQLLAKSYRLRQLFHKAQTVLSRMIAVLSSKPLAKTQLCLAYLEMANLHCDQGNYQNQLNVLHLALPLCSDLKQKGEDQLLAFYYRGFGKALHGLKRNQEALDYFTKSLESFETALPENHILLANAALHMSECLASLGRYRKRLNVLVKLLQWQGLCCRQGMSMFVTIFSVMRKTFYG
eukprot:m.298541 g.298541  ORF g.298541 m.298541 type:complete len:233 (+) comp40782_c0_seq66:1318-2016(+)